MSRSAAIFGCSGAALTPDERDFFSDVRPFGFILFGRNIDHPAQVAALSAALREATGDPAAPILTDQEGGRVARLRPPHWAMRPPAALFGHLYARDPERAREAAYLNYRLIAHDLSGCGITVNAAPCLDLAVPGATAAIGDRAFGADPRMVAELGRTACDALLDGGVLPVLKHMPGHGRAPADSHHALPVVSAKADDLRRNDFACFRALSTYPLAMTAHVVYADVDAQRPATLSSKVIVQIVRREIGFGGFLMTDDIAMRALNGPIGKRVRQAAVAGCDAILLGTGRLDDMVAAAKETRTLAGESQARAEAALARLRAPQPFDAAAAEARLQALMGAIA